MKINDNLTKPVGVQHQRDKTLDGVIERILFHNPSNGWTVLRLKTEESPLLQTVVGKLQKLSPGECIRFTGAWRRDPKHGKQFAANTCVPLSPATAQGVEKYLGSGLVPGLGPVMAKRIVGKFGIDTLEILKKAPMRLAEVEGIGPKRARAITAALVEKEALQSVMVFLESVGISPTYAAKIQQRFGNDAIRQVSDNPYKLATEIRGIGFISADRIAAKLGIPKDAPSRAEAGVLFALEELSKEGHVFTPRSDLLEKAGALLDVEVDLLESALKRLVLMGKLRLDDTLPDPSCYLNRLHQAEKTAAATLTRFITEPLPPVAFDPAAAIRATEKKSGIALAQKQKSAFFALKQAKLLLLTGGPGTGKTTLLKGIVDCLLTAKLRVVAAAPTGRAARRMAETTGHGAATIHRLLEFTPKIMRFERNRENPLEADVVVVDEVSMVDIELFAALLSALPANARLILVGDPDQLPSVGPGAVLKDTLALSHEFAAIHAVHLDEIFRQAQSSLIVTGAHRILAGDSPRCGQKGDSADLFMIEREEPEACRDTIHTLAKTRIPSGFGFDPIEDIQVLTPMHNGILGSQQLNESLQALLNPERPDEASVGGFRRMDKVMQVKNNYDLDVFNGDIGRITVIGEDRAWLEVTFMDRKVRYPASELAQLTLAYACSIHKSQGSEYPAVIIPVHTQHFVMLKRNLIYTAITRGRRLVVLVGTKRALDIAIRNTDEMHRNSGLVHQVKQGLQTSCDRGR